MSVRNLALTVAGAVALGLAAPGMADAQTFASTTNLNLRVSPGGPVIGVIPRGVQVHVHQCIERSGWCHLTHGGMTGWASGRFLVPHVAVLPPGQPHAAPPPRPRVELGIGFGRHAAPGPGPSPWFVRGPGWYGDHYWDGHRWYYDGGWYDRPRAGFYFSFGN
jgi:hypothetical protein